VPNKYKVMRFYQTLIIGKFSEVKTYLLVNCPAEMHEDIHNAKRAYAKKYKGNGHNALNWVLCKYEWASLKPLGKKNSITL